MKSNYADAVRTAVEAVKELDSDDPVRPIAFQEVLRAALTGGAIAPTPATALRSGERSASDPATRLAGRLGLTQLANLDRLPITGALIVVSPLKLVGGTGSPSRVLALVPKR